MKRSITSTFMVIALILTFIASPLSVSAAQSSSANIYASEVHKNNVGKILFSETSIIAGKETASQFTDKFTADSHLYAIAYLDSQVQSIEKIGEKFDDTYIPYETVQAVATISIDGQEYYGNNNPIIPMNVQDYQANKAYFTFEIIPDPKSTVGYNLSTWYENIFILLGSGNHEVTIDLTLNNKKIASGSFNIDWTNGDLEKLQKNAEECSKIATEYRANLRKIPVQFSQENSPYNDPLLSDENIKAMIMSAYKNCKIITKFVTLGASSDSWYVEKDNYDYPVAKYSTKDTWAIYQSTDGWSYIIQVRVKCDYEGFGVYGEPYIDPIISPAKIATKNVEEPAEHTEAVVITAPTKSDVVTANPTGSKVMVDGKSIAFEAYTIDGSNYFKLRDLAMAINGSSKQFQVGWDDANNAINLTANAAYTPEGKELTMSGTPTDKEATLTASKIYLNGEEVQLTAYNIGGNNYFKLRDIGKIINFAVTWDGSLNMIGLDTSNSYVQE